MTATMNSADRGTATSAVIALFATCGHRHKGPAAVITCEQLISAEQIETSFAVPAASALAGTAGLGQTPAANLAVITKHAAGRRAQRSFAVR